jgi:multiple sugar transport system ATP-binding protein
MSNVELRNISKRFKDVTALDGISFSIQDGEFFVLLGPTGAGKTTTLRVIAGLEKQNSGDVLFDGVPVNDFTPADRDVAFVFPVSLYPTKTVCNLAFPAFSLGKNLKIK